MKYIVLAAITAFLLVACSKEEEKKKDAAKQDLIGKWRLTETRISPGGRVDWSPVTDLRTITFRKMGGFSSTESDLYYLYSYNAADSLLTVSGSDREYKMHVVRLEADKLEMWGTNCIEGCGFRYEKMRGE